jgi:predicted nucleotidyltransferase
MVIGGYAVAYYGESRFTEDIDITLGIDINYLEELLTILNDEFTTRVKDVHNFVEKTNTLPIQDIHNSVKVDLIFSFIEFERMAIKRAESMYLDNIEIQMISASDLIIYKLLAARERDLEDVKSIMENEANEIDIAHIDIYVREIRSLSGRQNIVKTWNTIKDESL